MVLLQTYFFAKMNLNLIFEVELQLQLQLQHDILES